MQSKRFQWNEIDTKGFLNKALIQTLPVALIYIGFVIEQIKLDGFSWSDFVPSPVVLGMMILYVLNRIYDAIQRFISGK